MSEGTQGDITDRSLYDYAGFWNQFRLHIKAVFLGWDVIAALIFACVAAFHFVTDPAKDIPGMIQGLLPVMVGVLATLVAFVFAGLVFFVSFRADDKYIITLKRDIYSGFLFLFRWNAATGITVLILGLFVYMASYLPSFSGVIIDSLYLVYLPAFIYAILSIGTLFGTLARHGIFKHRYYNRETTKMMRAERRRRRQWKEKYPRKRNKNTTKYRRKANGTRNHRRSGRNDTISSRRPHTAGNCRGDRPEPQDGKQDHTDGNGTNCRI